MPSFDTTTAIAARPADVWACLVRTASWTAWDPQLESVDGELAPDGRIVIRVRGVSRPFKLRVRTWSPERRIVLRGGMPLGLFTGTRTYDLTADGDRTCFTMSERYSGPLAPLIGRTIPDLQPSFDAFAAGLRAAAES